MKVELTIDASYLSGPKGWKGIWHGIRELVQNARDAELEHGAQLEVTHVGTTLRIENVGCTIPRDALLIGHTTKRDDRRMAGLFGEGLKFGVLAMLRDGMKVVIRTGSEVWTPAIEESERFPGRQVLTFRIDGGREPKNRVRIEIEGVSAEAWEVIRDKFLFLYRRIHRQTPTNRGTLLLSPKFKGKIFVKGIHVMDDPELAYGYDFAHLELDRDRQVVGSYDLQSEVKQLWRAALAVEPGLTEEFLTMAVNRVKDVKGLDRWDAQNLGGDVTRLAADAFRTKYGQTALPVANLAESKDIEHLGVRGIVVPDELAALLSVVLGDKDTVWKRLREEVQHTYSWDDLNQREQQSLTRAVGLVAKATDAGSLMLARIDVVGFRSDTMMGQHDGRRLILARRILTDRSLTLETLVHEVAHDDGRDGDKGHVASIERIWARIVEALDRD